jgi:hypothetical protein
MGTRSRKAKPITDAPAGAFFNRAVDYHEAARQLFDLHPDGSLSDPINFLYFHTTELALKAFLRSHDVPVLGTKRQSHKLTELYEQCRSLGLKIGQSDRVEIENIVRLLDGANEDQGLRYFSLRSGGGADLSWTHEIVEQLMRAVEPHVEVHKKQNPVPAVLKIRWGKPRPSVP